MSNRISLCMGVARDQVIPKSAFCRQINDRMPADRRLPDVLRDIQWVSYCQKIKLKGAIPSPKVAVFNEKAPKSTNK